MNKEKDLEAFRNIFRDIAVRMDADCDYWHIIGFVDEPKGDKQSGEYNYFDHEYVDQNAGGGMSGDEFYGNIYLSFGEKYLKIEYHA